jgi:hypothetical protein
VFPQDDASDRLRGGDRNNPASLLAQREMNTKDIARTQFNRQAETFSFWVATRDARILQQLFDLIGFSENDELLDVALGLIERQNIIDQGADTVYFLEQVT